MASSNTRVLVTNKEGLGVYMILRFFDDRLTLTEEATGNVITIALTSSLAGDNNGDQDASTVPLGPTWGLNADNLQDAALELSGSVGAISLCSYILRTADPMMPNATVLSDLPTGILRNTEITGEPVIAGPEDFPTLNQDTNGNAATATALETARNIHGQSFNGTVDITIPNATAAASGVMSPADKSKLDGIASGAIAYVHPATHPPSIIAQDASNRFVTDVEIVYWDAKEPAINLGTSTQYYRGDKTWQTLPTASGTATDIKMNGVQSAGVLTTLAKADHIHPVDTSRAAAAHNQAAETITSGYLPIARLSPSFVYAAHTTVPANGVLRANLGSPTVAEMAMFSSEVTNKTQFLAAANLVAEYYNGTIWQDLGLNDTQKKKLVSGRPTLGNFIIPGTHQKVRFTVQAPSYMYLNYLYMYLSTNGNTCSWTIEKSFDGTTWDNVVADSGQASSWPGHMFLSHATIAWNNTPTINVHWKYARVTINIVWNFPANGFYIYNLDWWGGYPAVKREMFDWDEDANIIIPRQLKSNLATGTAPFVVASTTKVDNLNADLVDGFQASQTPGPNNIPVLSSASVLVLPAGVQFPATAVSSANANTLDDYAELSFVPVISGTTVAGTNTYDRQAGLITKIGRQVTLSLYIRLLTKDAAMAGNIQIGGLPHISNGTVGAFCSVVPIGITPQASLLGSLGTSSNLIHLCQR